MTTIIRPHRPIAHRVARRHATSEPPDETRLSLTCSDRLIAADDVSRTIYDQLGRNIGVVFRTDTAGDGIVVPWDGVDESGVRVRGRLVLHAGVAWDRVVASGEIKIDGLVHGRTASQHDDGHLATLHEIVAMGRDLVQTLAERPTFSIDETIAAVGRIVEVAARAVEDER
jgi:hypothetical protein